MIFSILITYLLDNVLYCRENKVIYHTCKDEKPLFYKEFSESHFRQKMSVISKL